tara:strand:- start:7584 stop:8240 length:657 start_codon:yes stop_codon:yes gene_type:complete
MLNIFNIIKNARLCKVIPSSSFLEHKMVDDCDILKKENLFLKNKLLELESTLENFKKMIEFNNINTSRPKNLYNNYNQFNINCDIFVSYKQNDNSDAIVMNIHYSLKETNIDVWLDKMRGDERSEKGMINGVESCKLFCAVISPEYFKSYFCILELNTAIKMEKKIVVCFNGNKYKIQEALRWIPNSFDFLKNDEIIKLDEDNEYMQIGIDKIYKRLN